MAEASDLFKIMSVEGDGTSRGRGLCAPMKPAAIVKSQVPGRALKTAEFGGFYLEERSHPGASLLPPHFHEVMHISFIIKGGCVESFARGTRERAPYELFVTPPGEIHSIRYGPAGARSLSVEINERRLETIRQYAALPERLVRIQTGDLSALAVRLYQEFRTPDGGSALAVEGLLLEMLAGVSRHLARGAGGRTPRSLGRAAEFIHAHFGEAFSLSRVAEAAGLHPVYLARAFRRHYRQTVGDYTRRLRVEYACRELASTDAPLAEIALAAGFCAQSHFAAVFKRHTGLTPTEYRAAFRPRQLS